MSAHENTRHMLKVEIEGEVTSFRYPHFTQGYQPTYDMPPPSTIYGLVCSAAGNLVDPKPFEFGYHFQHSGKFVDYKEHLHYLDPIQPNPLDRELLFKPRLTLYLNDLSLTDAFRRPRYTLTLGRSQDLMRVASMKEVVLINATQGLYAHTLLPLALAPDLETHTVAATMPRYVDERRHVTWSVYAMLTATAVYPAIVDPDDPFNDGLDLSSIGGERMLWVDPEIQTVKGQTTYQRVVCLHRLME